MICQDTIPEAFKDETENKNTTIHCGHRII
jgi:hypothetical protein